MGRAAEPEEVVRIAGRESLSGATANLPAGRRIGLVGRNGAGKTTLVNELVSQATNDKTSAKRFDGTIADNLRLFDETVTREQMASYMAHLAIEGGLDLPLSRTVHGLMHPRQKSPTGTSHWDTCAGWVSCETSNM